MGRKQLYLIFNHMASPIGEYLLDRRLVIGKQKREMCGETRIHPVVDGDEILLPNYEGIEHLIGDPHALVIPKSETTANYIALFCAEEDTLKAELLFPHRRWQNLFMKTYSSKTIDIEAHEQFELHLDEKKGLPVVRIGKVFSVRLSPKPLMEKYYREIKG